MRKWKPPRPPNPSTTEEDQDDFWQAQAGVGVGSISHGWETKKKDKKEIVEPEFPIGFDIRPGVHRPPMPHETWGPEPKIVWSKRRGK